MGDNKVNMALDDIIKLNKQKARTQKKPVRNIKASRQIKGGKRIAPGKRAPMVNKRNNNARPGAGASNAMNSVQTKRLVQKLVKKALSRRGVTSAVSRPAITSPRGGVRSRIQMGSSLARVNARSRVIGGARTARAFAPQVQTIRRRGRGFAAAPRVVYDDEEEIEEEPVQYVQARQPRQRPFARQQQRGSVVIQRVVAPAARPIQRRAVPAQRQRVIVQQQPRRQIVQAARRQFVQPARQQFVQSRQRVIIQRPVQQQQRQRVIRQVVQQRPRRQETVQYVEARTRKNNNFRNAMGIGQGRARRVQNVDRFEPSTSFIQGRTIVRRGRGFTDSY